MTLIALKCPHCHSELVGKQRYICTNPDSLRTTFYTEYTYNACKPSVKEAVRKQTINGSGVRAVSRCLGISTDTVIAGRSVATEINVGVFQYSVTVHGCRPIPQNITTTIV